MGDAQITRSGGTPTGTAGAPSPDVVSVQGVVGGTPVTVTGTVATSDPSVGLNGAAAPTSSTQAGGSDGANLQACRVFDLDTGAGAEFDLGVSLRLPAGGGSVAGGTGANPLRVDPTGTTTQPISAVALPLPAGAATEATLATRATEATLATRAAEATLATRLADATFTGRINTLGQKTMAASTPVVIASDQSAVVVADGGGSLTVDAPQLPAALVGGRLDENVGAWLGSTAPTVGQKTMASSVPVVIASDQSAVTVTGTVTNASVGTNGAAAPTSSTQAGGSDGTNLQPFLTRVPAYMASTSGLVTGGTAAATVTSLAYLFHPGANTKRVEIYRIVVNWSTTHDQTGNGIYSARVARITSENVVPGGTTQTVNAVDQADAASTVTFLTGATGAPTRAAGDYSAAAVSGNAYGSTELTFDYAGKPLIARASTAEGYEVRVVVELAVASALRFGVTYYWTERT